MTAKEKDGGAADHRQQEINRLNQVIAAIRDVGRLLVNAPGKECLARGVCDILVEKRGYFNACIGLFGPNGQLDLVENTGCEGWFDDVRAQIGKQLLPRCVKHVLDVAPVFSAVHPASDCPGCPVAEQYAGRRGLSVRLAYRKSLFGFMILSIPKPLAGDTLEIRIVREMADDIAAALYRLDQEKKRKKAEQATRESRVHFKTLIENSLNYISIIQDHAIIYQSSGRRKIHSLMDRVFDPPLFLNVFEGDRKRVKNRYTDLVDGVRHRIETDFRYYPWGCEHKEANLRWALISATKIDYKGVASVLTNIMDITDSVEVQNFLRIQDKMISLGRVTAGIAHEIRNPLSGIYIYLKALKKIYNDMGDITKVLSIVDKIELASNKIESIIKRVMDFSKPGRPRFITADLNPYIDEVTQLTAVTLRKCGIRFVKNLDPDMPRCWAEPHLIEQVVLNLVTNAAEAMKGFDGEKKIELTTSHTPQHVYIRVEDTGPGIAMVHQSKIFDPFYTTKNNSSGIGLSICHRIILDHNGTLKFKTAKNKGTQFTIELPLTTNEAKRV